jgi:hypothetical protein
MEFITSAKLDRVMILTGYTRLTSQILRSGILINIFKKDIEGITSVVLEIPPPQYDFQPPDPKLDIDKQLEEIKKNFFEDLQNTMQEMLDLGIKISAIVFHGGGTLEITDSFKKFCEDNGIKFFIYDPKEEIPNSDPNFEDFLNSVDKKFSNKVKIGKLEKKFPETESIFS